MKKFTFLLLSTFCVVTSAFSLCVREISNAEMPVSGTETTFHVVVDAGHGGMDGGVTGKTSGVKESDLNLSIAYRLKDELEDAGFLVTMTRKTEFGICEAGETWSKKRDMQQRKKQIRESNPSLVVSIHQNRYSLPSVRGGQVFYKKGSDSGKSLAVQVQERLNRLYQKEDVNPRNATPSSYYLLECTDAPSIIVECGFLSSPADEGLLLKNGFQEELALSIFSGIMGYYSEIYGS
ncbi:MAG: N-acetylmuramoyl-L-alanine amidase [Clostridia bacterium]|nr:N-acetylmuramoyl-L-alanine amidase [Clostridia bacterium]